MLEKFGQKFKEYGENIRQSTQSFSESVSINNQIKELAKECDELYLAIGRKYYEECQNDVPDNCREEFDAIREKLNQIEELHESLRKYTGTWQCPNCGAENPSGAQFCSNCGTKKAAEQKQDKQKDAGVCPQCGAPYHEGDIFCGNCGFRLDTSKADDEASEHAENMTCSQAEESSGTEQYREQKNTSTEDTMMADNRAVDVTLQDSVQTKEPETNMEFKSEVESETDIEEVNAAKEEIVPDTASSASVPDVEQSAEQVGAEEGTGAQVMFCPNCGARLSAGSIFCEDCGTRVR